MVSLIGCVVSTGSYEESISMTVDKPGCVETTWDDSGRCDEDDAPEVLMVLDSLERGHLRRLEMASSGKGGLSAILCE